MVRRIRGQRGGCGLPTTSASWSSTSASQRLLGPELSFQPVEDFGPDLHARLTSAYDLVGRWAEATSVRLGNDEGRDGSEEPRIAEARKHYFQRRTSPSSWDGRRKLRRPMSRRPTTSRPTPGSRERALVRGGALALVVVDLDSQIGAITGLAGDVKTPGLCHALTDVLVQSEIQAMSAAGGVRTRREWLADQVDERGAFDSWVEHTVERVTRVSASFHVPNPRTSDDIEPAVQYLNRMKAKRATMSASNPDGIDPFGDPVMQAALNAQGQRLWSPYPGRWSHPLGCRVEVLLEGATLHRHSSS